MRATAGVDRIVPPARAASPSPRSSSTAHGACPADELIAHRPTIRSRSEAGAPDRSGRRRARLERRTNEQGYLTAGIRTLRDAVRQVRRARGQRTSSKVRRHTTRSHADLAGQYGRLPATGSCLAIHLLVARRRLIVPPSPSGFALIGCATATWRQRLQTAWSATGCP